MGRCWLFLCGFAWILGGCESAEARQRSDARALLGLHKSVDYKASEGERAKRVADLDALVLVDDDVRQTRDLCVSGHRAVLRQKELQDQNAAEIEKAVSVRPEGTALDPATLARLTQKVSTSDAELAAAHERLLLCEDKVRALELRFGAR
jgi:hypothetical protein